MLEPTRPKNFGQLSAGSRRLMDAVRRIQRQASVQTDPDRAQRPKTIKQSCPNARVYLTAANPQNAPVQCLPTRDQSDKAHAVFETTGRTGEVLLVPAERVDAGARPRRYPQSQLTSRGVAFDSSFDELAARERRLASMGLARRSMTMAEAKYEAVRGTRGVAGLRAVVDRNHAAYEVGSIQALAMEHLRAGHITREQYEAMVKP